MKRVLKYSVSLNDSPTSIRMPENAKIVLVGHQSGNVRLWAEVNDKNLEQVREFVIHGTGRSIPDGQEWVASFQMGSFVWHVYEVKETV